MARVKDNNRLRTQKTVLFDFDKDLAREGRQGNFEIAKLITVIVADVTWLKYYRYGVKHYPINP